MSDVPDFDIEVIRAAVRDGVLAGASTLNPCDAFEATEMENADLTVALANLQTDLDEGGAHNDVLTERRRKAAADAERLAAALLLPGDWDGAKERALADHARTIAEDAIYADNEGASSESVMAKLAAAEVEREEWRKAYHRVVEADGEAHT